MLFCHTVGYSTSLLIKIGRCPLFSEGELTMANKHPDSPNKLTEFAPLSSDSKPSGSFFSRLFKRANGQFGIFNHPMPLYWQ